MERVKLFPQILGPFVTMVMLAPLMTIVLKGFARGVAKDRNAEASACQAGNINSETGNCDLVPMPDGLLCDVPTVVCLQPLVKPAVYCSGRRDRCGVCDSPELNATCDDGSACTTNDRCVLNGDGEKSKMGQATNCTESSSACSLGGQTRQTVRCRI